MKTGLIVMLTHNDVTAKDACDVFMSSCDVDAPNWGFKNIGITNDEMDKLVKAMKAKGKRTFLEIVTYDELSCLDSVKTGIECGIDEIMGGPYFPSVHKILKRTTIAYKPFVGKVSGSPSVLEGSCAEIIGEAKRLMEEGINGFDLLAYRHKENGGTLARQFCGALNADVCVAGSISSFERIDTMFDINPWAFTVGGALFEKTFMPGGSFRENLLAVLGYMKKCQPH